MLILFFSKTSPLKPCFLIIAESAFQFRDDVYWIFTFKCPIPICNFNKTMKGKFFKKLEINLFFKSLAVITFNFLIHKTSFPRQTFTERICPKVMFEFDMNPRWLHEKRSRMVALLSHKNLNSQKISRNTYAFF